MNVFANLPQTMRCFLLLCRMKVGDLMLKQSQATLDNHVLENGSRRNINRATLSGNDDDSTLQSYTTTQVDSTSDCEMVQLNDLWNARNALEEVRNLLEVGSELDERGGSEAGRIDL